ncbi:MFS transporter [Lysinibacillus xylanilyticus]|uniref:MFS transporter n=1 Tax=Lysinibacillus xylanilyticus TaxID=582475 RepID=UPI00380B343F
MKKIHFSWIILIVTFVSIISAGIIRSSSGVFIVPFEEQFGWARSSISFAFAVGLFLYGLSGPFMAAFVEKYGLKRMMLISMSMLVVGLAATFVMKTEWQLILIWGVVIGLGSSLFLTVISPTIANRWFVKKRGLALGILTAATATGQLVLLPILATLIENYSWHAAILLILGIAIVMLVLILVVMKNYPSEKGIAPYGEEDIIEPPPFTTGNPFIHALQSLGEGLRSRVFWLLAGSFFICGLSTSGLIGTHFISYCISFEIPVVTAASMLSLMGIFDLVGTTFSGWLSDRFDNRWLLFWYYGLRGLSLLALPVALASGSYAWLVVFAVFYGLDWIATVPPTVALARQHFGLQKSAMMYGWMVAFHQVGAGLAAYSGGIFYEAFASYKLAFVLAGGFCLLASLFVIGIKKQKEPVTY